MTSLSVTNMNVTKKRRPVRKFATRTIQYLILSILVVLVVVPIVMLVFGALKTRGELMSHPYTLPIPPRWENLSGILINPTYSFWQMLRNSLLVMVAVTFLDVMNCSPAVFVLARMEFLTKEFGLQATYARRGIDYYTRNKVYPYNGDVTLTGLKVNIEVQVQDGIIKGAAPTPEKYIDLSYLRQAQKELGVQ